MLPFGDPIVIHLLRANSTLAPLHGGRVGLRLENPLPAFRVANIGDVESTTTWERATAYQVEIWAANDLTAGQLATTVANVWPSISGTAIPSLNAYVSSCWVHTHPRNLPDTTSDKARYLVDVALRYHWSPTT